TAAATTTTPHRRNRAEQIPGGRTDAPSRPGPPHSGHTATLHRGCAERVPGDGIDAPLPRSPQRPAPPLPHRTRTRR
ncbi:hypothetical protein AB0F13_17985, partial [Streptomyces sp. NPDC026206]|uniref:hypothetical protein n=1 Tax=Streptomyces sp. NPDC026206 TaxID=3157089 RepID=UPI0033DCE58E